MSREQAAVSNKEPLMHISKRDGIELWKAWAIRGAAVLLSLVVCAIVIVALTGLNPLEVYKGVFDGAVGSKRRTWMTIRDTLVLLCIAIGITPAFKMRFWNIGAEGQVLIGGVASAAMMLYLGDTLPAVILLPLMLVVSALAAMVWGLIPAFFKANWNTNETLFTLMMNYVAMQVITVCIIFWENPKGSNSVGTINSTTRGGWIPELFGLDYGWNLIIVLALTLAMFVYLKYSKQGYEIAVVGESEATARLVSVAIRSGMDPKEIIQQMKGIRCPSCLRQPGVPVSSCPYAIAKALEKVMKVTQNGNGTKPPISAAMEKVKQTMSPAEAKLAKFCPECGSKLEHEGGCVTCRNCGYSKCG